MRLGFTGTRHLDDSVTGKVLAFVDELAAQYDEFTTGACVGFDFVVATHLLKTRPEARHRLVVPQNRSQVELDIVHEFISHTGGFATIELMPEGSDYRDRNLRIIEHSDAIVAVAQHPEDAGKSKRSGTWMTVRMADVRSLPVHTLVLNPA